MILCDTNVIIEFQKKNPSVVLNLRLIGQDNLAISVITEAELYFGAFNKTELRKIKAHLYLLHRLPLSGSISTIFIELMESYTLSHNLSIPDALIAATALEYKLPLYTFNIKDFRYIPGLILYTPPRHAGP